MRSHAAHLAHAGDRISNLAKIAGYHLSSHRQDFAHDALLGILPRLVGGGILKLSQLGAFGCPLDRGRWQDVLQAKLDVAHSLLKQYHRQTGRACTQPRFTVLGLKLHSLKSVPVLKAKMINCVRVMEWMCSLFGLHAHRDDEAVKIHCCSEAFMGLYSMSVSIRPRITFTESEVDRLPV